MFKKKDLKKMVLSKNQSFENNTQQFEKAAASILVKYFENKTLQNAILSDKEQEFRDFISSFADFIQ